MHDVDVLAGLNNRGEQVVGGVDVVVHRVALGARGLHRIRRGALFGEVDDGVGAFIDKKLQQPVVVLGDIDVAEPDGLAG